jgi:hypothetical protein
MIHSFGTHQGINEDTLHLYNGSHSNPYQTANREVTPQNTIIYDPEDDSFDNIDIRTHLTDQGLIITQQDFSLSRQQRP